MLVVLVFAHLSAGHGVVTTLVERFDTVAQCEAVANALTSLIVIQYRVSARNWTCVTLPPSKEE